MNNEKNLHKILIVCICLFLAVFSCLILGKFFSSPDTFLGILRSISERVETTLKLTASATAASAGISALPGDIGTPIADRLSEFSEYGLFIVCVLYAEKYLLTIIGGATFGVLIPATLIAYAAMCVFGKFNKLVSILCKALIIGLVMLMVVPLSTYISDSICETYQTSIEETISSGENLAQQASGISGTDEEQNAFQKVISYLETGAAGLANQGAELINRYVEGLAIMTVTSCLIPLVTLAFALWVINQVFGVNIIIPMPRSLRKLGGKLGKPAGPLPTAKNPALSRHDDPDDDIRN